MKYTRVVINHENNEDDPLLPVDQTGVMGITSTELWASSLKIAYLLISFLISMSVIAIVMLLTEKRIGNQRDPIVEFIATILGILAAICASLQFIPQILTTLSLKKVGSLSIPSMLIQCPGSFLFAFSIFIQSGTNWTSYITYLIGGILQGILLVICIYFHFTPTLEEPESVYTSASSLFEETRR